MTEAWREVDGARSRAQELQSQVEELQEEVALQEKSHNDSSLLSELENNLDAADWRLDKEQVMHCNLIMPDWTTCVREEEFCVHVVIHLK